MKPTILLIGRPVETITLGLLGGQQILKDEQDRDWLDIVFDGGEITLDYSNKVTNNFLGLANNLANLGFDVFTNGTKVTQKAILRSDDKQKTLAVWDKSDWQMPESVPQKILFMADAHFEPHDLNLIENYKNDHPEVELIVETDGDLADNLLIDQLQSKLKLIISKADYSSVDSLLAALSDYTTKSEQVLLIDGKGLYFAADGQTSQVKLTQALDEGAIEVIEGAVIKLTDIPKTGRQKLAIIEAIIDDYRKGKEIKIVRYLTQSLVPEIPVQTLHPVELVASPTVYGLLMERAQSYNRPAAELLENSRRQGKLWLDLDFDTADNEALNHLAKQFLDTKSLSGRLAGVSLSYGIAESDQVEALIEAGVAVIPLIDNCFEDLVGFNGEQVTYGLEALGEKISNLITHNIRFAKWRIKLKLSTDQDMPSDAAILSNSHLASRFASRVQQSQITPVVELTIDADDHDLASRLDCYERSLRSLMAEMKLLRVDFKKLILQTNLGGVNPQTDIKAYVDQLARIFKLQLPKPFGGILISDHGLSQDQLIILQDCLKSQLDGELEMGLIYQQVTTEQIDLSDYYRDELDIDQAKTELDLAQFKQNLTKIKLD